MSPHTIYRPLACSHFLRILQWATGNNQNKVIAHIYKKKEGKKEKKEVEKRLKPISVKSNER